MPIALAINSTNPFHIYSPPPSYFPVQTVNLSHTVFWKDIAPEGAFVKTTDSAAIIWMIYTNMFMNQSEIYRTAIIIHIQLHALKSGIAVHLSS